MIGPVFLECIFCVTNMKFYKFLSLFHAMGNTQFNKKIKIFYTDLGGEYVSIEFATYLSSEGITH